MGPPPTPDADKEVPSMKRAREESDNGDDEQGNAKKVDSKGEES